MFNSTSWPFQAASQLTIGLYSFALGFAAGQQLSSKVIDLFSEHSPSSLRFNQSSQKPMSWSLLTIPLGVGCVTGVTAATLACLATSKYFSK